MINSANIIAKQNNSYVINDPNEWFQLLGWGNNEKWYTITINNGDGDMRPFLWKKNQHGICIDNIISHICISNVISDQNVWSNLSVVKKNTKMNKEKTNNSDSDTSPFYWIKRNSLYLYCLKYQRGLTF